MGDGARLPFFSILLAAVAKAVYALDKATKTGEIIITIIIFFKPHSNKTLY